MPRMPRRPPRLLLATLLSLVALVILFAVFDRLYTDLLWFRSVHHSGVFSRRLTTEVVLFFVFGLLMALAVGVNIVLAYRLRPPYRPASAEQHQLEALTNAFAHLRQWALAVVLVL